MPNEYGRIWRWISMLFRRHQCYMSRQMEKLGIGMGRYHFILAVCEEPGLSQDSLTQLGVNKSTVARALFQLEKNGYLTREVNPADKRAYKLFPTEKAYEARRYIFECCADSAGYAMEGFTEEEMAWFAEMLRRMAERFPPPRNGRDGENDGKTARQRADGNRR